MPVPVILAYGETPLDTYTTSSRTEQRLSGFTVPAGTNALFVSISHRFNANVTVEWQNEFGVQVGHQVAGSGGHNAKVFRIDTPLIGMGDIVATTDASVTSFRIVAYALSGVDLSVPTEEVLSTFGAGLDINGGDNFYTPQYDDSLLLAVLAGVPDEMDPITGLAPGWNLDEVAGVFHTNPAATSGAAFFHKSGSQAGVQESFTFIPNESGSLGLVIVEIKSDPNAGGGGPEFVPLDPLSLTLSGAPLVLNAKTQLETSPRSLVLTGKPLAIATSDNLALDRLDLALAGRSLSLNAKSMLETARGSLAITGKTLSVSVSEFLALLKVSLALAGKPLTLGGGAIIITLEKLNLFLRGRAVTLAGQHKLWKVLTPRLVQDIARKITGYFE